MSHRLLYEILDTVGDGSGTKNANVDGSSTAVTFKIICPIDKRYFIQRMIVQIKDAGPLDADKYGGLAGGLTNGLDFTLCDNADDTIIDMLSGIPIKTNADWGRLCYDVSVQDFGTGTDDAVSVRWTFSKDTGGPLVLGPGDYLCLVINDDLRGLISHYFSMRGYWSNVGE